MVPSTSSPLSVRETRLTATQNKLLHTLEQQLQLQLQEATHAPRRPSHEHPEAAKTLCEFIARRPRRPHPVVQLNPHFLHLSTQLDDCMAQWRTLYAHAHASQALVAEMEASHGQVATKTQALYQSFEAVLHQVDALDARVASIAAPLPHFTAIEKVAHNLGFGVTFAAPSSMTNRSTRRLASTSTTNPCKAVHVFQHRREIDPTMPAFEQALTQIDASVAYLTQHLTYKDAACYLDAYQTLASGAIHILKDYALSGLEAAKDAVIEALEKDAREVQQSGGLRSLVTQLDAASPLYVNFQLVAPALAAVAKQLERTQSVPDRAENVRVLIHVTAAYATQRVQLVLPVLGAWLDAAARPAEIGTGLRIYCAQLLKVVEAEYQLFVKLFGHGPSDDLFTRASCRAIVDEHHQDTENAFERLIGQLCGAVYNSVRPQLLAQKDLEGLCEVIEILQSEVIEAVITPRASMLGAAEPVMHRMIQDAQERLILCLQKYIQDAIENFVPSREDVDYPAKLHAATDTSASLYATWYPTLERTLWCLAKGYHFVKLAIFEELAQEAIQCCTASLKRASNDITATHGPLHGSLFLIKHLLILREQLTPFDIQFAQTSKALDFASSTDALHALLVDASTRFQWAGPHGLVELVARGLPKVHETRANVQHNVEQALKTSCTAFLDVVVEHVAQPLLGLLHQLAHVPPQEYRQCAFTAPQHVATVLASVLQQLQTVCPRIRATIHLYLGRASTESILVHSVQQTLLDAVEHLKVVMEQTYTHTERGPCEAGIETLVQQLHALSS